MIYNVYNYNKLFTSINHSKSMTDTAEVAELPDKLSVLDFYDIVKVTENDLVEVISQSSQEIISLYSKIKKAIHQIRQLGWLVDLIPLPISENGVYWSDFADDYLREKHGKDYYDKDGMYLTFYLDKEGKHLNPNKEIIINYSQMKKETKEKVLTIFYKELPNNFEWSGSNNNAMFIHYAEGNYPKIEFSKLKDNDTFPQLSFHIHTMCEELDDMTDLDVYTELEPLFKNRDHDFSYGCGDIEIEIFGVDDKEAYNLYMQIDTILNKYQDKKIKKHERVKHFSAYFYSDDGTEYVLVKSKYMRKNKKDLTMKDFSEKYKGK